MRTSIISDTDADSLITTCSLFTLKTVNLVRTKRIVFDILVSKRVTDLVRHWFRIEMSGFLSNSKKEHINARRSQPNRPAESDAAAESDATAKPN